MESMKGEWLVIRKKFSIEEPGGEAPTSDNPVTIKYSLSPQTVKCGFFSLAGWDSYAAPTRVLATVTHVLTNRILQITLWKRLVRSPQDETGAEAFLSRHTADHTGELVAALTRLAPRTRSRGEGWHWDPWAGAGEDCTPASHLPWPPLAFG